jgi:hypothetical protein
VDRRARLPLSALQQARKSLANEEEVFVSTDQKHSELYCGLQDSEDLVESQGRYTSLGDYIDQEIGKES